MKFIDEATITVRSGNGGKGCVSFRREKFIPRGGPDGGDGGSGGDIILEAVSQKRTLYHFRFKSQFKAQNGTHGQGKHKTGKNGADLRIEIPPGTVVRNYDTGEIMQDFAEPGMRFIVAAGGRGGRGNAHFKSSTHRSPRLAQPGQSGIALKLKLELKLLADVGIIGLPNAGKSTLITALSAARPKIGSYPFTTLTPTLGVVVAGTREPFVVADIPGLIEGAHQGAGLGIRFLRHIERTRILIHLIDVSAVKPQNPLHAYTTINRELALYSQGLAQKPQIVVLNKLDLPGSKDMAAKFPTAFRGEPVRQISALAGTGIDTLKKHIVDMLDKTNG